MSADEQSTSCAHKLESMSSHSQDTADDPESFEVSRQTRYETLCTGSVKLFEVPAGESEWANTQLQGRGEVRRDVNSDTKVFRLYDDETQVILFEEKINDASMYSVKRQDFHHFKTDRSIMGIMFTRTLADAELFRQVCCPEVLVCDGSEISRELERRQTTPSLGGDYSSHSHDHHTKDHFIWAHSAPVTPVHTFRDDSDLSVSQQSEMTTGPSETDHTCTYSLDTRQSRECSCRSDHLHHQTIEALSPRARPRHSRARTAPGLGEGAGARSCSRRSSLGGCSDESPSVSFTEFINSTRKSSSQIQPLYSPSESSLPPPALNRSSKKPGFFVRQFRKISLFGRQKKDQQWESVTAGYRTPSTRKIRRRRSIGGPNDRSAFRTPFQALRRKWEASHPSRRSGMLSPKSPFHRSRIQRTEHSRRVHNNVVRCGWADAKGSIAKCKTFKSRFLVLESTRLYLYQGDPFLDQAQLPLTALYLSNIFIVKAASRGHRHTVVMQMSHSTLTISLKDPSKQREWLADIRRLHGPLLEEKLENGLDTRFISQARKRGVLRRNREQQVRQMTRSAQLPSRTLTGSRSHARPSGTPMMSARTHPRSPVSPTLSKRGSEKMTAKPLFREFDEDDIPPEMMSPKRKGRSSAKPTSSENPTYFSPEIRHRQPPNSGSRRLIRARMTSFARKVRRNEHAASQ
eukprot:908739_1